MVDKLVVTNQGVTKESFTLEELADIEVMRQHSIEQAQLALLQPSTAEIEQAEFELKSINLLTELGVI